MIVMVMGHYLHIYPSPGLGQPSHGQACLENHTWPCFFGRHGLVKGYKREGDGRTPIGHFTLGPLYWRPLKPAPLSGLNRRILHLTDGWCDDHSSAHYNRLVNRRLFKRRCENLWNIYDCFVVIGYNDRRTAKNRGSAIFIHAVDCAAKTPISTAGCIGFARIDLLAVIRCLRRSSRLWIHAQPR